MILRNGRTRNGGLVDIRVERGVIAEIVPAGSAAIPDAGGRAAAEIAETDLGGRLVLPLLVNGHAHLDKTFLGAAWQPHRPGASIRDRILQEKRTRAALAETADERAMLLAHRMVEFGTGYLRAHVDVDAEIGLEGVMSMLRLREALRDVLDIQIVAFPQSGILSQDGVVELLDESLRLGADVIGGLDPAGIDDDIDGHLDAVFALAERRSARVDIHLHATGGPAVHEYRAIVERTRAAGLEGLVTISHGFGLGLLTGAQRPEIFDLLAEAGVSVMTNGPAGPMPPVLELVEHGVTAFAGTDNVRDAWSPFGSGDPLETARTVAYQSGFLVDDELALALDMVTGSAATALGLDGYGLLESGPADLLVVDAPTPAEALVGAPVGRQVMRSGQWISQRVLETRSQLPGTTAPQQSLISIGL